MTEDLDKDTKAEFERWATREGESTDRGFLANDEEPYSTHRTNAMYRVWRESRMAYSYVAELHRQIKWLKTRDRELGFVIPVLRAVRDFRGEWSDATITGDLTKPVRKLLAVMDQWEDSHPPSDAELGPFDDGSPAVSIAELQKIKE